MTHIHSQYIINISILIQISNMLILEMTELMQSIKFNWVFHANWDTFGKEIYHSLLQKLSEYFKV